MLISLARFLIDPFNIFWMLLFLVIVTWFLKRKRLFKWAIIITGIWFLIISTPLIPTQVLDSLESRYEPIKVKDLINRNAEYHILILGGGHGFDDRLPSNSLLSQNALGRLNEAIRLHQQLPNSVLIFSGYSASGKTTQAEMLLQTALSLGIVEKETMLQKDPVNTYEEAEVYSTKYGNTSPIILVTNAAHMPRAVNSFNNFGLDPLASPTNYRLKGSWRHKWFGLPSMRNIENLKVGIYEYAALFWYSL